DSRAAINGSYSFGPCCSERRCWQSGLASDVTITVLSRSPMIWLGPPRRRRKGPTECAGCAWVVRWQAAQGLSPRTRTGSDGVVHNLCAHEQLQLGSSSLQTRDVPSRHVAAAVQGRCGGLAPCALGHKNRR